MNVPVPRKLVEYNFSYPKKKPKKQPNQDIINEDYNKNEKFQEEKNEKIQDAEEDEFWVDCKK